VHLHPHGGENFFSDLICRKNVKVHPQPEQESIFRTVFAWWLRVGGIFRRSLRRRRLKKGRQLFLGKKCTHAKSRLRLCAVLRVSGYFVAFCLRVIKLLLLMIGLMMMKAGVFKQFLCFDVFRYHRL